MAGTIGKALAISSFDPNGVNLIRLGEVGLGAEIWGGYVVEKFELFDYDKHEKIQKMIESAKELERFNKVNELNKRIF